MSGAVRDYPRATPYTKGTIVHHAVGVALNVSLVVVATRWLVLRGPEVDLALLWIAIGTLLAFFVADFVSGLLHWAFDTWFDEHNAFLHRMVVIVREHHLVPQAMFRYPFYYDAGTLSWIMALLAGPVMLPVLLADAPPTALAYGGVWMGAVLCVVVVFMLEFHKCGHRPPARGVVGLLQRCHLILRPGHHGHHHRAPYTVRYCLVNGWADHVLDWIGFFRKLEWVIHHLTGAVPRENDRAWLARYRGYDDPAS